MWIDVSVQRFTYVYIFCLFQNYKNSNHYEPLICNIVSRFQPRIIFIKS